MRAKCDGCPVLGTATCVGQRDETPKRLCFLGRGDKRYARLYREQAGELEPLPPPSPELLARQRQCPHYRKCPTDCLIGRCDLLRGHGAKNEEVDPYDCLDCPDLPA
jgi:hypothetical protein